MLRSLFIFISAMFLSCNNPDNGQWQQKDIAIKLQRLFPGADSVIVLNSEKAIADKKDSIGLPSPLYKAWVKEKNTAVPDYLFYFYHGNIMDTGFYAGLLKPIVIYDLKAGLGNSHADYILPYPYFDSTGSNKAMVMALSVFTQKDAVYQQHKQQEILKAFGLSSKSGRATIKR